MMQYLRTAGLRCLLVGDCCDRTGSIKEWDVPRNIPFVPARSFCIGPLVIWQRGLLRLALRGDLDTIIYLGNAAWPATWISATLARLSGKRVLFRTHGWIRPDRGIKRLVRKTFYRLAHGLLLYGHRAKMIGLEEGFAAERLHVVYNALDYEAQRHVRARMTVDQIRQIRQRLFASPNRPLIICVSRLIRCHRLDLLLEALARLKQRGQEINLLLVGDGPEMGSLRRMAEQSSLSVCFYGACYDDTVLGELQMSANVTVAPGPIGLTAMQSLAYGTPVITHDDGTCQMPEWEAIIPGRTGSLFRRNDVDDLARVIEEWTGQEMPDESIRSECASLIDRFYNAEFHCRAVRRAVRGRPADDLFWMKETDY